VIERDLVRIAFLSRRFAELQGLRTALLGALLLLVVMVTSLLPEAYRDPFAQLLSPLIAWSIASFTLLDRYYTRSFGRVPLIPWRRFARLYAVPEFPLDGWSGGPAADRPLVRPMAIGPLVVSGALVLEAFKSVWQAGGLSITALALTGYSLSVLLHEWKQRPHYLLGLLSGGIGIVITSGTPVVFRFGVDLPESVGTPYIQAYVIMALGLVATGLLDHRLLWRAMSRADAPRVVSPDPALSRVRVLVATTVLLVLSAHIAVAGWPGDALVLHVLLSAALMFVMLGVLMLQTWRDAGTTAAARARARAERLEAQVAALRGERPRAAEEPLIGTGPLPRFDTLGHLLLPMAVACGATTDIALRGAGGPSLLAAALAASHLRIAWRDWPPRGHYLLGALAASISAVHFAFVPIERTLDWVVWFLLLMSAAWCVEGLRDLRLSKNPPPQPGEEHAHTV
jgi:hypothetical protein